MKILVIEDDETTGAYIAEGLREEGHSVDLMIDGRDALVQATTTEYDILIVDRMLPGLDGMSLVKTLRGTKNTTPVLFLTSLGGVDDRIEGLNAGGDDYLVKPFAFGELSARVNALARRPRATQEETVLRAGDLEMDLVRRKVVRARARRLTFCHVNLPCWNICCGAKGRVQTRTMLLESVWDIRFDPQTNVVETHISRLRSKVDKPFDKDLIKTERGSGYRIED